MDTSKDSTIMQTTLETIGQLERRLNLAVPVADIESEVEKRLARLAKNVKVPGFRPGKVPMKMVAQQYGPQVRNEVITDAVQAGFADAMRDQNVRVAGYPRIEPAADAAVTDKLMFSAVFEVYPDIRLGDLSTVDIERPVAEVGPEDVQSTIDVLRKQRLVWEPVSRAAAAGDRAVVDFTGKIDGVEFPGGQAKDFPIVLGEARMLPEFEAAVAGMSAGESKSFGLVFPADYHGKEVAGKAADFALTVKAVEASKLPEVDAEFAKAFGIASGDLAELRAEIGANLKLELKRKIESRLKEQALAALRAKAELPLPRSLVELEAQGMAGRMAEELRRQGMKAEDIKLSPEMFKEGAAERVALGLIVAEVVRANGLGAKPEQVKEMVQEAAQTYEQPDAVVRWHYEKPERLNEFEALAVERNVVDWVLARARVVDKPARFADVMGPPPK
jgi:trigger factor